MDVDKIEDINGYKCYKGMPLEDAEIQEVGELIIEKYQEFQAKIEI